MYVYIKLKCYLISFFIFIISHYFKIIFFFISRSFDVSKCSLLLYFQASLPGLVFRFSYCYVFISLHSQMMDNNCLFLKTYIMRLALCPSINFIYAFFNCLNRSVMHICRCVLLFIYD